MRYEINKAGNLVIRVTPEEQKELLEMKQQDGDWGTTQKECEFLEPLIANSSLQWIAPQWVGALTDAPLLGTLDDPRPLRERERQEDFFLTGAYSGQIWVQDVLQCWGFMDYQVVSFLEVLLQDGEAVFLSGAEAELFDATRSFESIQEAVEYCRRQECPLNALKAIVVANMDMGEFGFAADMIREAGHGRVRLRGRPGPGGRDPRRQDKGVTQ